MSTFLKTSHQYKILVDYKFFNNYALKVWPKGLDQN